MSAGRGPGPEWSRPSRTLGEYRYWALRAAEQAREYGEPEAVWESYLDTADRVSDVLDRRAACGRDRAETAGCTRMRARATPEERTDRDGCLFPRCLAPLRRSQDYVKFADR